MSTPQFTFLRLGAVRQRTGLTESSLYRLIHAQQFPAPFKISERSIAWREDQISEWCVAKAEGRSLEYPKLKRAPPRKTIRRVRPTAIERVRA
jgi:prophage regulatory protein